MKPPMNEELRAMQITPPVVFMGRIRHAKAYRMANGIPVTTSVKND